MCWLASIVISATSQANADKHICNVCDLIKMVWWILDSYIRDFFALLDPDFGQMLAEILNVQDKPHFLAVWQVGRWASSSDLAKPFG